MTAAAASDMTVGGAGLAAQAFKAGLVDECQLFLAPVIVGGDTRSLPDDVLQKLELSDVHRFDNGVIYLQYRVIV
jgi:riboflavin biosynthesis pyrimidine reductase